MRELRFSEAINEATDLLMEENENVVLMGLGVTDPKGIFGTTEGLLEKYGSKRVIETPTAENGFTGVAVGAALVGMRPIITHQRVEFALLAIEQIVNQAAKWRYMTGGASEAPIVVRLIVGRGWGQGPQHSQSLESWFAHIPGLRVVSASNSYDAKGLMIASVHSPDPVVLIEHRWLHNTFGPVPAGMYSDSLAKAKIVKPGKDISIVTYSYMVTEALKVAFECEKHGLSVEVVDLRSLRPIDMDTVICSISKTRKLLTIDNGWKTCGIGSEVISQIVTTDLGLLDCPPIRLGNVDVPIPSTRALADLVYNGPLEILQAIENLTKKNLSSAKQQFKPVKDVPDQSFIGPF